MLTYELGNARLSDEGAEVWRAELSYDFDGDVPVLRSVDTWTEVGSSRLRVNAQRCQIVNLEFEPPPIEEFAPASIGLDVKFPKPASE